ncbi:hypothetical protein ECG_07504 [Echinococcus granulosus]|nr:hypothetical protein ECG_07504 [Echinococcus granulosus]
MLSAAVLESPPLLPIRSDERKRENIRDADGFRQPMESAIAVVLEDLCRSSCGVIIPKGEPDFELAVMPSVDWFVDGSGDSAGWRGGWRGDGGGDGGGSGGGVADCDCRGRGGIGGGLEFSFIVVLSTIDHRKWRRRLWVGFAFV